MVYLETQVEDVFYVRYGYSLIRAIFGPIFRLVWVRDVNGLENIPSDGAAIIAFNHQSYFDFICFIAVCPRQIHFLSAEKFFEHFIWKHLMKLTGQIRVYRRDHDKHILHATVRDHLRNGKVIGIFPEGTRSPHPKEMLHAFTGVAKYSITGMVPVIPVGIQGAYEVLSKHAHFPKFKKIISFNIGLPIRFNEHYGKSLNESEYRSATDRVMLEISKLSGKAYNHVGKLESDRDKSHEAK